MKEDYVLHRPLEAPKDRLAACMNSESSDNRTTERRIVAAASLQSENEN
jgi:hypothetical protein